MKKIIGKLYQQVEGVYGLLLTLYSIIVFSTAIVINRHLSRSYFIIAELFIIILSIIICPKIIRYLSRLTIHQSTSNTVSPKYLSSIKCAFYLVPFFYFFIYYIAFYPGGFSPDSIRQYTQAINNSYNDWHPVMQTIFAFTIPITFTKGWIGSIVLFQIICFSLILGYSLNTIYQFTNFKYTVLSMAFIFLNPQLGYISMFPWKDISFTIGSILLLTYSLRIFVTRGQWIQLPLNRVLYIITLSLTTLFRHNAILFTAPLVFAITFYLPRNHKLLICLSTILLCIIIKQSFYSILNVEKPDKRQIETLGLPMTIIGAVTTYTPELLDDETKDFVYKIATKDVWQEKYRYGSYNEVKWDPRTNNNIIEEYGFRKVISMMFRSFQRSKKVSIIALIKLTEAVYTITDNYNSIIVPMIVTNEYGIKQTGCDSLQNVLNAYSSFIEESFPHIFMYLGVIHFLLLSSFLSKLKTNNSRNRRKFIFLAPVFTYNFGTTLLLTSITDSIRFFFYTFPIVPILLVFIYLTVS